MKTYRTAQGKTLDMSALVAKNEKVRAVGNLKVNARGDTIDGNGKVIVPATQKVGETYQRTVGNKSAQPVRNIPKRQEMTKEELDLDLEMNGDIEVEKIKAKDAKEKRK